MNLSLGLRTLLLLTVVFAATAVLVQPALLGLGTASDPALNAMLAVGRN